MEILKTNINSMKNAWMKIQQADGLIILLLIYIYSPFIKRIAEGFMPVPWYLTFGYQAVLLAAILLVLKKVNRTALIFIMSFAAALLLNFWLVPYKRYVVAEGLAAWFNIAIPCLLVSSEYFEFERFLKYWYKFAKANIVLLLLSILLFKLNVLNYAIFAEICVPNVFIISFVILNSRKKEWQPYVIALFNIIAIAFLGGRTSALVSLLMLLIGFFFSPSIRIKPKLILLLVMIISALVLFLNLEFFLKTLHETLKKINIHSRSIDLLISQLKSKRIELSGRDTIYELSAAFIKKHWALPSGFGVPLFITNGRYYYAHNILLQFFILFGVPGSILVVFLTVLRFLYVSRTRKSVITLFLIFTFAAFLPIGLLDTSIWNYFMSTLFISILFFANQEKNIVHDRNSCYSFPLIHLVINKTKLLSEQFSKKRT